MIKAVITNKLLRQNALYTVRACVRACVLCACEQKEINFNRDTNTVRKLIYELSVFPIRSAIFRHFKLKEL